MVESGAWGGHMPDDYYRGLADGGEVRETYDARGDERTVPDPEFGDETARYQKGWWDGFNKLEPRPPHMDARPKREHIPKTVRFEVFKRDSFTCQYCGRKAPDIVLQIEHITPVSQGGPSDILNLVTSCVECNSGKGDRLLSESDALNKRREQLESLQERREQLKMLYNWHRELTALSDEEMAVVCEIFEEGTDCDINDTGRELLRRWIKTYGISEVLAATQESIERYFQKSEDNEERRKSAEHVFERIIRTIRWKRLQKRDPQKAQYLYAKGILRKRLSYVNWNDLEQIIDAWISWSLTPEEFCELAKRCRSWSNFRELVHNVIDIADKAEKASRQSNETDNCP
jgi:hypothetical protein